MAKYTCCGMSFKTGKELSDHVKKTHNAGIFDVRLSCCGVDYASATELTAHVRRSHGAAKFEVAT